MHKIKIILETDQENLKREYSRDSKNPKYIELNDYLFEIAMRKGLIEKTEDGYIFIGDYADLQAFKNKDKKSYDWIEWSLKNQRGGGLFY